MPFYLCSTPANTLDAARRERIANAITDIHCEETGAPPTFVHVGFADSPSGDCSVLGTIRAGRSDETRQSIRTRIAELISDSAGVEAAGVKVATVDVPASWVMEGGALLPEPGEEEDWLAAHHA